MTQKDKLIERLRSHPQDFTFAEAQTLLGYLGFRRTNKGKTSGSRVLFVKEGSEGMFIHIPHPQKELRAYQVKEILKRLEEEGLI